MLPITSKQIVKSWIMHVVRTHFQGSCLRGDYAEPEHKCAYKASLICHVVITFDLTLRWVLSILSNYNFFGKMKATEKVLIRITISLSCLSLSFVPVLLDLHISLKSLMLALSYAERAAITRKSIHIQRGLRRSRQKGSRSAASAAGLHVSLPRRSVSQPWQPWRSHYEF